MSSVAIIGGGMWGETMLAGMVRSGIPVDTIVVAERREDRAHELRDRHGVHVLSIADAVSPADTVLLVVKPQDMSATVREVASAVQESTLVISLAAGITTEFLEKELPAGTAVVRVMPNTPAQVGLGMAALSPGASCTEAQLARAEELMSTVGRVVRVPEELQDAVTAVSGSGPAYVFALVESLIAAGESLGLPPETATELVVQTVLGAATMLRETGTEPGVLREQVTSPGGTTAAALAVLHDRDVAGAYRAALEAARDRSRELASGQ